jgi:hypothetical protein
MWKILCWSALSAGIVLASPDPSAASIITQTLPGIYVFRNLPETFDLGSYTFTIPFGEQIISATLTGTFGSSAFPFTQAIEVRLDGLLLADCDSVALGCFDSQIPKSWTHTLAEENFGLITDGSAHLTGTVFTNLDNSRVLSVGPTTLVIDTGPCLITAA